MIPNDTEILITHGPPLGIGDLNTNEDRIGCLDLYNCIQVIKPKYHLYGHIHEGYGMKSDGVTTYINGASLTKKKKLVLQKPFVFDLPIK